jgi:hypothetical protein
LGPYDGLFHGCHLVYAWALGAVGQTAANLLGPLFLLLLGLALAESRGLQLGALGALLLSSPILVSQASGGGLTDLPVAAFCALALASFRRGDRGWEKVWGAAAVSVKLTAVPALLALALACRRDLPRAAGLLAAGAAGAAPWLVFNALHTGQPFFPLGGSWQVHSLLDPQWPLALVLLAVGWSLRRFPRLDLPVGLLALLALACTLDWSPAGDLRDWEFTLSPLVLAGLVRWLAGPVDWGPEAWGLLLAPLAGPRYGLPCAAWAIPLAAEGWRRGERSRVWLVGLVVGGAVSLAILGPRCLVAMGAIDRENYLTRRIALYPAYRWLDGQPYSRVLLTDPRGFYCPLPAVCLFRVWRPSREGLAQHLEALGCQAVVWNFRNQLVAQTAVREALRATGGDPRRWSGELAARGGLTPLPPSESNPYSLELEELYVLCRSGRVVYERDGVVVVEWPGR